jgi:ABC-2 type transport system ATP-binding protein
MQTSATIEARDLTKTYKDVRALDGLGFAVEAGTVFGLLGPNGAGKSTTVKILTTLTRPDSGQASVAGVDVLRHPDRVRRAIGLVAQRSGVDLEATGRENLALQGQVYGQRGAELRSRVGELLERFGLAGAADRVARGYSGGMQRRLDIAMGLIHRPQVLFLGRAHHRARPRGPGRHVGRDRPPVRGRGPDHPAHHPLPGGGRPAGRAPGHR